MPAYRFRSEKFFSRSFKDLAMSFTKNPNTNDFGTVTNENAIKQSVRNLVLTSFGERPFQYEIGSRVPGMLFEPFDVFFAEDMKDEIVNTISRLEPRVQLQSVRVAQGFGEHEINVSIEYTIVGQSTTQTIDFLLERT
ncbi:baseplate wedge subunit [Synechococcus phage S-SZBM1]|uniref:Baseplate wedge subunit n=1 Tax=Synechococcus phage S-SZBM1 TaxID=2926475 RepID=A0AC61TSV7_9CAUD|nr:baseplate wedge subunit [Synechococcus phage S-SZBM1]UNH61327.1 baseplate wedge subunit [Synechococcus phage S-SZBM1]